MFMNYLSISLGLSSLTSKNISNIYLAFNWLCLPVLPPYDEDDAWDGAGMSILILGLWTEIDEIVLKLKKKKDKRKMKADDRLRESIEMHTYT